MLVEIILKILHLFANTPLKLSLGQFYFSFPQIAFHPFQTRVRAAHFVQVLAQMIPIEDFSSALVIMANLPDDIPDAIMTISQTGDDSS